MIRRPPRSTLSSSSAASDVYKRQHERPAAFYTHTSIYAAKSAVSSSPEDQGSNISAKRSRVLSNWVGRCCSIRLSSTPPTTSQARRPPSNPATKDSSMNSTTCQETYVSLARSLNTSSKRSYEPEKSLEAGGRNPKPTPGAVSQGDRTALSRPACSCIRRSLLSNDGSFAKLTCEKSDDILGASGSGKDIFNESPNGHVWSTDVLQMVVSRHAPLQSTTLPC